jgi:hypothetical protein
MIQFLEENNILYEGQSGFRKQHSCETAIHLIVAGWKEKLDKNDTILAV